MLNFLQTNEDKHPDDNVNVKNRQNSDYQNFLIPKPNEAHLISSNSLPRHYRCPAAINNLQLKYVSSYVLISVPRLYNTVSEKVMQNSCS